MLVSLLSGAGPWRGNFKREPELDTAHHEKCTRPEKCKNIYW